MRTHWLIAGMMMGLALVPGTGRAAELNKAPKGFVRLFNGKDLTHFKGLIELPKRAKLDAEALKTEQAKADDLMRAHWSVEEGVLVYDGKGNSLQTAKDYGNFEMYVDWRIQQAGDSGIYVRGNPQIQIWDNPIGSGGLYNNQTNPSKPLVVADRPVGEWNTFYIKMVGDRVTVKLNDKVVVDDTPLENYWERGAPLPSRGPIELQHHGNRLEFRNIFIRELPENAAAVAQPGAEVTLELANVPLPKVLQLVAAAGAVQIVLDDPEGRLTTRKLGFISIRQKPVERALALICQAAAVEYRRDAGGVYRVFSK
jgi:hypothetical protein